jgi:hypothetical protein
MLHLIIHLLDLFVLYRLGLFALVSEAAQHWIEPHLLLKHIRFDIPLHLWALCSEGSLGAFIFLVGVQGGLPLVNLALRWSSQHAIKLSISITRYHNSCIISKWLFWMFNYLNRSMRMLRPSSFFYCAYSASNA